MTTFQKALEQAKKGNWEAAWKIAKEDEDLLPGVTREAWLKYTAKIIERQSGEATQMPAAYYS